MAAGEEAERPQGVSRPVRPAGPHILLALRKALLPVAMALAAGACQDSEASPPFPTTAYEGRVRVLVTPPGDPAYDERGRGTARFGPEGGSPTRLSVIGAISDPRGDTGLELEGAPTAQGGWQGHMGNIKVHIDRNGTISGGGVEHPQAFTITGQVTPESFDMVMVIELLEQNAGGLPAGTTLRFDYGLEQPRQASRGEPRTDLESCSKVAYEVRPTPDPAGGTLVLRRVPVCKD